MRKYMTKEVTFTQFEVAVIEINEQGLPVAVPKGQEVLLGSVSTDKLQKYANDKHKTSVHIYNIEEFTKVFKMKVSEFIQYATVQEDNSPSDDDGEIEDEIGNQ